MSESIIRRRPEVTEYFEFYEGYVSSVPDGDIIAILQNQLRSSLDLLRDVPPGKIDFRYAPGKWSLKEVVGHVLDIEWTFAYRALTFARCDAPPLPGVDHDEYMGRANFAAREMSGLVDELEHLRCAGLQLFDSFDAATLDRGGVASGYPITVRAILYIIAGHAEHHMNVLRERYLTS